MRFKRRTTLRTCLHPRMLRTLFCLVRQQLPRSFHPRAFWVPNRTSSNFLGVKSWNPARLPVTMQQQQRRPRPIKDQKTALCLIPPRSVWGQFQEVRCFRDKGFCRWPPHVNLIYPFVPDEGNTLEKAAERASQALASFSRFPVRFETLKYFVHGARSATVWVDPVSEHLVNLQAALAATFPDHQDLNNDPSRSISKFVPHLSLGQWPGKVEAESVVHELLSSWKPVCFEAWEVVIISRKGFNDPFTVRYSIPLGLGSYQEVNVPYIPTLANSMLEGGEESLARFGIGALSEGVWNFAYGANVNRKKLEVDRRITPLESVPGVLPGYRLAFNHRGAMGNVMALSEPIPTNGWQGDAHGVLHRVKVVDYVKLTNMEDAYQPVELMAQPYGNRDPVLAVVYVTPMQYRVSEELAPTDRYINLITFGGHEWGLDSSYLEWLAGLKTIGSRQRTGIYWQRPSGERIVQTHVVRIGREQQKRRNYR